MNLIVPIIHIGSLIVCLTIIGFDWKKRRLENIPFPKDKITNQCVQYLHFIHKNSRKILPNDLHEKVKLLNQMETLILLIPSDKTLKNSPNSKTVQSIIRFHAEEIREVYHLFQYLKEMPDTEPSYQQMVVNRANVIFTHILHKILSIHPCQKQGVLLS